MSNRSIKSVFKQTPNMKCFLLTFLATSCLPTAWCAPETRIVGGEVAERGQFPWQAMIVASSQGQIFSYCGGALISRDYVLTAAQCVNGATRLKVYLGAHNISLPNEANRVIMETENYIMHQNFSDTYYDNDIAIVQLPRSISRTPYIDYVKVPKGVEAEDGFVGWFGTVAGWGFTKDSDTDIHDVLKYSFNTVLDPSQCVALYGAEWMTDKKVCIATGGGRGPCYGDAGGPVVKQNEDGSFTLMGLFSFLDTDGCTKGRPVGFTRVGAYIDWMREEAGFVPV